MMKPKEIGKKDPGAFGKRFRNSNLLQAWLVLVLAIGFGAALSGVQAKLGPVIEQNKLNETLRRVPELVWGSRAAERMARKDAPVTITPKVVTVRNNGKTAYYRTYEAESLGRLEGRVVKAGGQGYADRIEMLVGVDPSVATITGIFILEQKETPGLGNKIVSAQWRNQFAGRQTDRPLEVAKGGADGPYDIDAITGATISSRSVTGIVNRALRDLKTRPAAVPPEGSGGIKP